MKSSLFFYELKRIIKSRFTQISILMVSFFPLVFSMVLPYINQDTCCSILGIRSFTLLSQTILIPAKAGAVFSVVIFTALTVFEFDKILRFRVNNIIEPISSSIKINITKIIGLICVGIISVAVSIVIMIPYYIYKMGSLIYFSYLLFSYVLIILGSIMLTIFMTAGFYLMFRKVNITCIIMLLAVLFSFLAGILNYQYMWAQTGAGGFSENFGTGNNILGMIWNRLFGLTVSLSILTFGIMSDRCYEKGFISSFIKNCKRYKLLLICLCISCFGAFFVFKSEPIFKSISPVDFVSIFISGDKDTPVNTNVKGTSNALINLKIEKDKNYASGSYVQELQNDADEPQDIYFNLSYGYCVKEVKLDDVDIDYTPISYKDLNSAKVKNVFRLTIPKKTKTKLSIRYSGTPKSINVNGDFSLGINKDYINLRKSSDIAPVVCVEKNNKAVEGTVNLDSKFTLITSGDKNKQISEENGYTEWSFSYNKPDELCLTAGQYGIFERKVKGTNVEFFYPIAARSEFESRGNDTLDIFTFFSEKFGPLCRDSLKVVITSGVNGGTGAQQGNISYISEDCLNQRSGKDSPQASSSDTFSLLTHEIAHQWWGGGIDVSNEKSDNLIDKKHDEWSNEAFAEISTYLFLKEKFGNEYAESLLLKNWKDQAEALNRNFYQRNPEYMNKLSMIPKYNVYLFLRGSKIYGLGPFTLYKIYNDIGEENYINAMKYIYKEYYDKKDKKLSFTEFLNITGVEEEAVSNE